MNNPFCYFFFVAQCVSLIIIRFSYVSLFILIIEYVLLGPPILICLTYSNRLKMLSNFVIILYVIIIYKKRQMYIESISTKDTSQTIRTKLLAGKTLSTFHRLNPFSPQGRRYPFSQTDLLTEIAV
jgi:hypothetical protein